MNLKEKLLAIKQKKNQGTINWEEKKQEWLDSVQNLYKDINQWLEVYIKDDLVSTHQTSISIVEEYMGSYETFILDIEIGNDYAVFEPVGRNIIGAAGRVDFFLQGEKSTKFVILALNRENHKDEWIMVSKSNREQLIPFTKESFIKKLEEWLR